MESGTPSRDTASAMLQANATPDLAQIAARLRLAVLVVAGYGVGSP
jgi:hypothetical protein